MAETKLFDLIAVVRSLTPPQKQAPAGSDNTLILWGDTNVIPNLLKWYDGTAWVEIAGAGDKHFEQTFINVSTVAVAHNLNKKPAVAVMNPGGLEIFGLITHVNDNNLTVDFDSNVTGTVICN